MKTLESRLRQLLIDGEDFTGHERYCPEMRDEGNCQCGFENWLSRKEALITEIERLQPSSTPKPDTAGAQTLDPQKQP